MKKVIQDHKGNIFSSEKQMCEKYGISTSAFYQRYHVNHWTLEDALSIPVRKCTRKQLQEKPENADSIKKQKTVEEKFVITSKYPSQGYVKYLKYNKSILEKELNIFTEVYVRNVLAEKIEQIEQTINEISNESNWYQIMDMLYLGEYDLLKQKCSDDTLEKCMLLLQNPLGLIKDVYVNFASQFNMLDMAKS